MLDDRRKKTSLSLNRKRLLELMQRINFGRIEGLLVQSGEPIFNERTWRVLLDVKFGSESGPRPQASMDEVALKKQVWICLPTWTSCRMAPSKF